MTSVHVRGPLVPAKEEEHLGEAVLVLDIRGRDVVEGVTVEEQARRKVLVEAGDHTKDALLDVDLHALDDVTLDRTQI